MNNRHRSIFNALKYTWRIPRRIYSMEEYIKIYGEPQRKNTDLEILQEKLSNGLYVLRDDIDYQAPEGDLSWLK